MTSRPRGALRAIAADALQGLRARRRRLALSAASVFAAALVLGVVVTAAYTLDTGFERAADRADFPSVIARFDDEDRATIDARLRRLPNLEARAYRTEVTRVRLSAPGRRLDEGVIHVVESGRRGAGVPLMDRRDLGGGGRPQRVLARMAQLADPHVRDAQSPARGDSLAVSADPRRAHLDAADVVARPARRLLRLPSERADSTTPSRSARSSR